MGSGMIFVVMVLFISFLFNILTGPIRRLHLYQKASIDLLHLNMSLLYLKTIETSRLLFVSLLEIGISLVFLMAGLILFHTVLFLYAPWNPIVKFYVGIFFAAMYLFISGVIFFYIFSQSKWLMIFHAETLLDELAKKSADEDTFKNSKSRRQYE